MPSLEVLGVTDAEVGLRPRRAAPPLPSMTNPAFIGRAS